MVNPTIREITSATYMSPATCSIMTIERAWAVTGMTSDNISPGAIVFDVDGKEYRVDPILEEGSTDYFIIFRDATSKDTTYPAGRYLYAAPPKDGKMIVDFNKAYNPPCAFTPFATCPLPPLQNRLPFRIEAGEKKYAGADH